MPRTRIPAMCAPCFSKSSSTKPLTSRSVSPRPKISRAAKTPACPAPTRRAADRKRSAALLVGAGHAGVLAAREILGRGDTDLDVKGFVDDDLLKQGAHIAGIRVLGMTDDLPRLVKQLGIDQVVITIAQISRPDILRIIGVCRNIPVKVRIIPGLYEILQGKVHVTRIRNVRVEDLLGREPVSLEEQQVGQFLAGRTV